MTYSEIKVVVDNLSINVRTGGKGRPVLFLHGAGGVLEWTPFMEDLAQNCSLWVPDHPGFGKSDDPDWIRNIGDLAMYYLDFFDQVGAPEGFDVVGHSLGGWIAAEIAVRNSAKINSITLISPAGLRVNGLPMGDPFLWNEEESARHSFFSVALQERRLAAQPSEEVMDLMIKNKFSFAKHAWHPRLFNPDLAKWLHRIKVPTQIIWGRDDELLPAPYANAWQARIVGSRVTVIDECGHLATVEKGVEIASQIKKFVEELS